MRPCALHTCTRASLHPTATLCDCYNKHTKEHKFTNTSR